MNKSNAAAPINYITCPYCEARFDPNGSGKPAIKRLAKSSERTRLKKHLIKMWIEAGIPTGCGGYQNYERAIALVDMNEYSWAMQFWVKSWARQHVGGF